MAVGRAIVAAGVVLAFVSAVVPRYSAAYLLRVGVLLAGIAPYLVYDLTVALFKRHLTVVAGAILLAVHAGLVIVERFAAGGDSISCLLGLRCCSARWWSWPSASHGTGRRSAGRHRMGGVAVRGHRSAP